MRSLKGETLRASLAYLIVAAVMTWPLIVRLATHVPMGNADVWLNYWNLWWWKTTLLQGRSPYYSEMIFFPTGIPLGLHTHSPANMLWTLPINVVFGMGPALNLAIFAGFVLAGVGGFLLAREYTQKAPPAFLGGLAFAYFPQHVDQATEHLNLASYWAMPLFLWALVRCIRRGSRGWTVATGFFFALNALLAWHNALLSIPLGVGLAIFEIWRGSRPVLRVAFALMGAATLGLLLLAPFLWPVLRDTMAGTAAVQKPFLDKAIALPSLFVPHPGHPVWGPLLVDRQLQLRTYSSVGSIGYLGFVVPALALCTLLIRAGHHDSTRETHNRMPRGTILLWWLAFLFFLTLSLGESLEAPLLGPAASIGLPFRWLKDLPLFGLVRIANRFLVPAMLALSMLAAIGATRLGARLAPNRARFVTALLGLLILFDYAWLPFPMRPLSHPEWPDQVRQVLPGKAILDVPMSHDPPGAFENYLQTLHLRPTVGGYIASGFRPSRQQLEEHPALWRTRIPYRPVKAAETRTGLADTARDMGVGLVVVHLDRTTRQLRDARDRVSPGASNRFHRLRLSDTRSGLPQKVLDQIRGDLSSAFGEPIYRSPTVEVYRVSSSTGSP